MGKTVLLQGVFNSKQGAAGKSGDETIWLEKDVLGPLAGTNTAFLFQVMFCVVGMLVYILVFALCPPDEQLVESNKNCGQCNLCKSSLPCTLQVFCLVG